MTIEIDEVARQRLTQLNMRKSFARLINMRIIRVSSISGTQQVIRRCLLLAIDAVNLRRC
jgi:hypothetical protein